jgi:soluble lytic murein transglycosylase
MGDEQAALSAFAQAIAGDPRPGYAFLALVELVNAGVEVDEHQRGMIDFYAGSYQAAIEAFERYHQSTATEADAEPVEADKVGDAHYYTARSWLALGDPGRAVQACEHILEQADAQATQQATGKRWGDLWLLKAEAQIEAGETSTALTTYLHFAQTYPEHALAPKALGQAALLLERDQRYVKAADRYTALADHYPDAENAHQARFRAGLWRYWIGDLDGAMGAWSELAQADPDSPEGQQSRYWLGKTLWEKGWPEEAQAELDKLARQHPRTYYGLRAAHLLAREGQDLTWQHAPKTAHLTSSEAEEHQDALDWLSTWADLSAHQPERAISRELSSRLQFRRAAEMHALGLRDLAQNEFDALRRDLKDPLLLYELALFTRDLELYAPSLRAAIALTVRAPEETSADMPRLVQRLAYPAHYPDLVLAESASRDLDPLLLYALIWQESVFDAQVASWAGAVGLTQIMPSTGQWIAEMTAWPQYDETLLRRAYLNVKFGAWFLDRLLDQADGDVFTALAGYNGGPGLARGWQERSGGDPDLLVEIIPKTETQRYLRAIYRHYDMYHRLYAGGPWQPGQ